MITKHLRLKWLDRYGEKPTEKEIEAILSCGALACESREMRYPNGDPWNSPGVYVDFKRGIALLADETPEDSVRVITMLDERDMRRPVQVPKLRVVGISNR